MPDIDPIDTDEPMLEEMLYAQHVAVSSEADLKVQRGTPIPALFNQFYKFIQNPSTVSMETFKRMVDTDDTIGAGIDFLQTCLAARIGPYMHKNPKITEFVNQALNRLKGGFYNNLKDTMEAVWAGFSVQEIVWKNTDMGFVPDKLVPLPPTSLLFETDRTGELTEDGVLQYQRNYNPAQLGYGANYLYGWGGANLGFPDPYAKLGDFPFPIRSANTYSYLSIRIPKLKCLVYSNRAPGQYGNPYGRSLLRRAYKWWVMKDAFLKMLAIALDRKGTPLTVVFADGNGTVVNAAKAMSGVNQRGNAAAGERPDVAAKRAFDNIHNDSTIILPGRKGQVYELEQLQVQSNAEDFKSALELCDRALTRSLLIPSLIFTNGDGTGSFALGQEHAKTWEKILDGQAAGIKASWIDQFISQIIMYNFPEEDWKDEGFGEFTKRELTQDERDKEMNILGAALEKGVADATDLEDLNAIRDRIGLKPRTKPIEVKNDNQDDENDEQSMV